MKEDNYLWDIKKYLMNKYGVDQAERDIDPLAWYIKTGRASVSFLNLLYKKKPFLIARRLHSAGSCGSYDDIINGIKTYIGYQKEALQ